MAPGPVLLETPSPAGEAGVSSDSGSPLHSPTPALEKVRLNRDSKTGIFTLARRGTCPASSFIHLSLIHSAAAAATTMAVSNNNSS